MSLETKFNHLISNRAKERKFKAGFFEGSTPDHVVKHPNPLPLGGGTPDEGFFPIESIHLNLINEPFQHLSYQEKTKNLNIKDINVKEQIHKINDDNTNHTYRYTDNEDEVDLATGLQYSWGNGFPQLRKFSKDLITRTNKPGYDDWDVIITNGSGDSLHKISDLFVEKGGTILVEEFTFTPFNSTAQNWGGTPIPIKLNIRPKKDGGEEPGVDPEYLDDLLTNWSSGPYKHLPKPYALYTIPTGQNPTGLSQSLELRKKIYSIAEKHDFIIVEDDPYGYISLPKYGTPNVYENDGLDNDTYIKSYLKPSYLTLDTSGRVVRLETFSKLFSPGLRLGFIVANKFFIEKLNLYTGLSTRAPSGVSQLVFNNIVANWGGVDGWLTWAQKIAKHYTIRRDLFLKTLYDSESFKNNEFEVVEPDAGMFIIVYINLESKFPDPKNWEKVLHELRYKTITNGVDIVFGNKMTTDLNFKFTTPKSNFLRLTIAAVHDNDEIIEAGKRLTKSIKEFFEDLNAGKYDDLK
ncbi:Aromatic amino acid aminotransferase 2 [Wickerhamomyces ciferrii]|uniref:Aromatic amino acid aminotransferase 2 n=1 Tax=Wickerhamomyces ciferrii (strain ATCC 14091 / BCRC 22168 / CBS 111 / JCM 3599 / NBRC 0793 / NRRL Y-1031 F-60-10) TaxID=1206466 RepID=K0KK72_WICCF|nr:Aromatic amino acid aminotransferase 2 [Wickerhamomyces ciferrii]CCH41864.1 Aromatic amino acid aminotransferase 2 [Wickerhamomyces ciferrii]